MATKSHTRSDLAEVQLDCAIDLYLKGDFIPAITLAGAAEELYGAPHAMHHDQWRDDPRAHKRDARDFDLVHQHTSGENHPEPWVVVNAIKNGLKHDRGTPLEFDPEDEPFWAIDRATQNRALDTGTHHPKTSEVDAAHRDHLARNERELSDDLGSGDAN